MPIINAAVLDLAFRGFKSIYTTSYLAAPSQAAKIAMTVPSGSRDESYGWLGQFPQLREWLDGERVVRQLKAHGFTIVNRKFESTVSVSRDDYSDDRLGVFKPMFAEMGHAAALHPDEIVFGLLAQSTGTLCYDGQYFFDTNHPVPDEDGTIVGPDGKTYSPVSNFDAGSGPTWYLLDTSRAVRPIIWQEREKYEFQNITRLDDERVFMTDMFLYGIRARVNAGFGLWQLAHASRQELNAANYAAIRAKMQALTGDQGRPLSIRPTTLVVPPQLEEAAFYLLNTQTQAGVDQTRGRARPRSWSRRIWATDMTGPTAICEAVELPAKAAPEWVHLLPLGAVNGRDGRRWQLDDPARVIARSATDGDLPIDYDHESEKPKSHGGPVPAAGWIKSLQARADGIWGKVEWTEQAAAMIAGREYRFLSPMLQYHPVTRQVLRLTGAGLVHRPNLALTALSEQEKPMSDTPADDGHSSALSRIAAALGLQGDADIEAIISAIEAEGSPDPARYVPIEAVVDLLKQRNSATANNTMRMAEAKVERAMSDGYLTPAMRPWALSLCSQDPDSFDGFIASALPAYAHLHRPSSLEGRSPDTSRLRGPSSTEELAICQQLGLSPQDLK